MNLRDDEVEKSNNYIMNLFGCGDVGNIDKYFGCNIKEDDGFTLTQPVMLQEFRDDFTFAKMSAYHICNARNYNDKNHGRGG